MLHADRMLVVSILLSWSFFFLLLILKVSANESLCVLWQQQWWEVDTSVNPSRPWPVHTMLLDMGLCEPS